MSVELKKAFLNWPFKLFLVLLFYSLFLSQIVFADDFPFSENSSEADKIIKGLSSSEGIDANDKGELESDKLVMGGSLKNETNIYQFQDRNIDDYLQNPSTLSLYLDSAFPDGIRAFFRGQFIYDGTVIESVSNNNNSLLNPIKKKSKSQLDELKIQFQIEQKIFTTLGIQKIKWGSGHFWNPTDFLNSVEKNVLETVDLRPGLDLIKLHLPWNDFNFYAIANLTESESTKNTGIALRAEMPYSTDITSGEFSITQYTRHNQSTLHGFDYSGSFGPIDLLFELSYNNENKKIKSVYGLGYEWQLNEESTMNISYEKYLNPNGFTLANEFLNSFLSATYQPFQLGKSYSLLSILFSKPFRWKHSNILFMAIQNETDKGVYNRLGYTWTGIKNLDLSFFMGQRTGSSTSEFKLTQLDHDYSFRAEIKF